MEDQKTAEELLREAKGEAATPINQEPVETPKEEIPETPETSEDKSRYQQRIDQLTAARKAAEERARQSEERLTRMEQERPEVPGKRPGEETPMVGQMTKDDWLSWHDEDPLAATEFVSDIRATQKAEQIIGQMQTAGQYTDTINQVYKAHPDLKEVMNGTKPPEESPFWQVYDEVAREMPEMQNTAKGPLIVMREAERRVKDKDTLAKERKIAEEAATNENERQQRVGASFTTGSTTKPVTPVNVKLSPEEERVARKMGLSPEEYNKNKKVK